MNINIQELLLNSGICAKNQQGQVETTKWALDMFAEHIIRECAAQAETKLLTGLKSSETHQHSYNEGLRDGVAEFKKYFGVEE